MIAPGADGAAAPAVPAESLEPTTALLRFAFPVEPELTGARAEAVALYRKCSTLWPEHIEVLYRLCTSYKEVAGGGGLKEIVAPADEVRRQLSYRRLWLGWLSALHPGHWNPGERRYWRSWISLRPWDRSSKRASYLRAVAICELVAELSFLIPQRNGGHDPGPDPVPLPALDDRGKVNSLLTRLAALLLRPDDAVPAAERLLRPDAVEPPRPGTADPAHIPAYGGRHYRRRATGWLATFNTACFFSQAIWLPPECIPEGFKDEEWRHRCAQAAIHELGLIHRDPRSTLDPNWVARDPDLEPLRRTAVGRDWMGFIGLRPAQAEVGPREPVDQDEGPALGDAGEPGPLRVPWAVLRGFGDQAAAKATVSLRIFRRS